MDAQTKSAAGVPAAIADKIENETPQAHQETDKLTAAAIYADEYRLTPASTGDILAWQVESSASSKKCMTRRQIESSPRQTTTHRLR